MPSEWKPTITLNKDAIIVALVEYAGRLDDPSIGWTGHGSSHPDLFKCERCGQEHNDSSLIPHLENCSAVKLLKALEHIKKWKESPHD